MSRKHQRKRRDEYIYGTTAGIVNEIKVTVDQRTGALSFETEMTNVYSEISYDRPKGPKVISRVPQPQTNATFDPSEALRNNFDFLCAVDTNTRKIGSKNVSVAGVVSFRPIVIPGPNKLEEFWKFDVPFCVELVGVKVAAENLGWITAYEWLLKLYIADRRTKIGMVVDSDLGNLKAYNERTKPVFGNVMLPPNLSLVYASADVGKDNLLNKAISTADSVSSQSLDTLQQGRAPADMKIGQSEWYDGMRLIKATVVDSTTGRQL